MAAEDYFLPAVTANDDSYRTPPRDQVVVEPLIDAMETFGAMELAIARATSTVHMTMWRMHPIVPLVNRKQVQAILADRHLKAVGAAVAAGHSPPNFPASDVNPADWIDLWMAVARLGVAVRIVVSDLDAILTPVGHLDRWQAYRMVMAEARKIPAGRTGGLQVIVSRHPHHVIDPPVGLLNLSGKRDWLLNFFNSAPQAERESWLTFAPGLWNKLDYHSDTKTFTLRPLQTWRIFPVTHHQKMCIVDRRIGFCGGLDVANGRRESTAHDTANLWHDVHCRVQGPVAVDLDRAFLSRWTRELDAFRQFCALANADKPQYALPDVLDYVDPPVAPNINPPIGTSAAQVLRTVSEASTATPFSPTVIRDDIAQAVQKAIGVASTFVYIENQYVRDSRVADWLIARDNELAPYGLTAVIVVLPVAPEEAEDLATADSVSLRGMALQLHTLHQLQNHFAERLGLYSMVRKGQDFKVHVRFIDPEANSPQVYMHSKVMIVDDEYAMIGSANFNPRSFRVDTEAAISWYDSTKVKAFRQRLWSHLLGPAAAVNTTPDGQFLTMWNQVAQANVAKKGKAGAGRSGFIVPHNPDLPAVQGSTIPIPIYDIFTEATEDNDRRDEEVALA